MRKEQHYAAVAFSLRNDFVYTNEIRAKIIQKRKKK
jgi:hypothetical protein